MGITGDNDPSTTLRQMRILGRAITEAAEDCLLARDMEQAVALMKIWDVNAKAIAKLRRDTGQKPKLRKSRIDLTARAVSRRAAKIWENGKEGGKES